MLGSHRRLPSHFRGQRFQTRRTRQACRGGMGASIMRKTISPGARWDAPWPKNRGIRRWPTSTAQPIEPIDLGTYHSRRRQLERRAVNFMARRVFGLRRGTICGLETGFEEMDGDLLEATA